MFCLIYTHNTLINNRIRARDHILRPRDREPLHHRSVVMYGPFPLRFPVGARVWGLQPLSDVAGAVLPAALRARPIYNRVRQYRSVYRGAAEIHNKERSGDAGVAAPAVETPTPSFTFTLLSANSGFASPNNGVCPVSSILRLLASLIMTS